MYFSVLSVLAFICTVFLSRNVVILAVFFKLPYKWEVWIAMFKLLFVLEIFCTKVRNMAVVIK